MNTFFKQVLKKLVGVSSVDNDDNEDGEGSKKKKKKKKRREEEEARVLKKCSFIDRAL